MYLNVTYDPATKIYSSENLSVSSNMANEPFHDPPLSSGIYTYINDLSILKKKNLLFLTKILPLK